jgi:hypothetical protein
LPIIEDQPSRFTNILALLADARREAVYGVARVAGSFATDLAEARDGLRITRRRARAHVQRHGDPDGELMAAVAAVRPRALKRAWQRRS